MKTRRFPEFLPRGISAYGVPESLALSVYLRRAIGRSYGRSADRSTNRLSDQRPSLLSSGSRVIVYIRNRARISGGYEILEKSSRDNPARLSRLCARARVRVDGHTSVRRGAPCHACADFTYLLFPGVEVPRARLEMQRRPLWPH